MVEINFKNNINADFNYSFEVFEANGCTPFDFNGYVFSGALYDFFGNLVAAVVTVTNIGNSISIEIAANSVTYAPAIYTLIVNGSDGFNLLNLANIKIAYFKI